MNKSGKYQHTLLGCKKNSIISDNINSSIVLFHSVKTSFFI